MTGGECVQCSRKGQALQRKASHARAAPNIPPIVHDVLRSPGQPLAAQARAFMEPRFGHDFSGVRVHADARAAASARALDAVAYTVGRDVVFAAGRYRPHCPDRPGMAILAHELSHVVQQSGAGAPEAGGIGVPPARAEQEADAASRAVVAGARAPALSRGIGPAVMALTDAAFRAQLGSTPQQAEAIDTLFHNAQFLALWNYLRSCSATPTKDLGPLKLRVTPDLAIDGVTRFGGYNPSSRTLEINPTKTEHVTNPSEIVDTIVHELIHAVDHLQGVCMAAGAAPAPLQGAATVSRDPLPAPAVTPAQVGLLHDVGPSASDPCSETIDENAAAQQIITRVIQSNIAVARVGHPTLTFVNMIIRGDPAALAFYNSCRTTACAQPAGPVRTAAITDCSQRTIARFIPSALTPALLPSRVYFDVDRATLRPDARETLHLVALYLASHPAVKVRLIGRADSTGEASYNQALSERRANAVKVFLASEGVPPAQIAATLGLGESAPLSIATSTMWRDRSVEITP
jgi:outer membrane protein OmpA-like peptidoglycan-associated protein